MYYTCKYSSPLGGITLASDGENLTGLWFDGQKYFADNLPEQYEEQDLPVFAQAKRWLDIYFSGREPDFHPAAFHDRHITLPQTCLGDHAYNSLWEDIHLWRDRGANCGGDGQTRIGAGSRRSGRPQQDIAHHSLPPRCRRKRQHYRVCGRRR